MPLTYKITSNNYVKTDITQDALQKTLIVIDLVVVIGLVLFIIKYKLRGLIACIAYIGFMAMDLLIIRYTNTQISIESLVAAIIILAINYTLTFRVLKIQEQDKEKRKLLYNSEAKSWIIKLLPVFIISIIFVFIKWAKIATFGMFMFWGILLSVIYTYLLTRDMIDK